MVEKELLLVCEVSQLFVCLSSTETVPALCCSQRRLELVIFHRHMNASLHRFMNC